MRRKTLNVWDLSSLLPIVSAARRTFAADEVMRTCPRNVSDPATTASAKQTKSSQIWVRHAKTSPLQTCHDKHSSGFQAVREAISSSYVSKAIFAMRGSISIGKYAPAEPSHIGYL